MNRTNATRERLRRKLGERKGEGSVRDPSKAMMSLVDETEPLDVPDSALQMPIGDFVDILEMHSDATYTPEHKRVMAEAMLAAQNVKREKPPWVPRTHMPSMMHW